MQILQCSATIPQQLQPFLNKYLSHPEYVAVDSKKQNKKNIEFFLIPTELPGEKTLI